MAWHHIFKVILKRALFVFFLVGLNACSSISKNQIIPCADAMQCINIIQGTIVSPTCQNRGNLTSESIYIKNESARIINATVRKTQLSADGNRVKIGESDDNYIVPGGGSSFVACVQNPGVRTELGYIVQAGKVDACFASDCLKSIAKKPLSTDSRTCKAQCTGNGVDCMRLDLTAASLTAVESELRKAWTLLSVSKIPSNMAMTQFVAAATVYGGSCTRDDLLIRSGPELIWSGGSCQLGVGVSKGPVDVKSIEFKVEGLISAPVNTQGSSFDVTFAGRAPKILLTIEYLTDRTEYDAVAKIEGQSGAFNDAYLWLTSDRGLCSEIRVKAPG